MSLRVAVVRFRWALPLVVLALAASSFTITFAQDAGAGFASPWHYERTTFALAMRTARAQLREITDAPAAARQALKRAQASADAFEAAASEGRTREALRHHRAATRALSRFSRWLLEREALADDEAAPPEERLRGQLRRLSVRLTELQRSAAQLDLELDFSAAARAAESVKAALAARERVAIKAALRQLAEVLDALESEVDAAADAHADAQADAQVQP